MAIYIVTAISIGVPGNSLVLFVLSNLKRKTSTDWFVIFIALCDVISLLLHGVLSLSTNADLWKIVHTQFLCKFDSYVAHFVFLQSSLLITCVGVDRYVKTCKPHSVFFTPKSALICCFTITIVSALFNISHLFTTKLNRYGDCVLDSSKATIRITLYIVLFIIFTICSVAIAVMYSKIAIRIRSRMKVGLTESINHNNVKNSKTYKRCYGLFSSNQQTHHRFSLQPMSQGLEQTAGTNTSCVAEENHGNGSSKYGIFNVSSCNAGKVHPSPRSLNEGASKSMNSNAQTRQPMQFTNITHNEKLMTKRINKTTKIVGAITLVFIISAVVPTTVATLLPVFKLQKQNPVGRVVIYFLLRLYIISFFANPLFYIWLSSNFRKKVIEILTVCKE